jgi:hypothetical protein
VVSIISRISDKKPFIGKLLMSTKKEEIEDFALSYDSEFKALN